jgi:UDP-N-acetylmuramyl pentapeptide phosphotransferase/UDP-N-acetylglucosamine-1-phosphate transferase
MGDVGSAFLGYSFAVLPVIAAPRNPRLVVAGALVVWPFLFDSSFTFLRRLSRGENVFAAHRSHLYQRLIIVGYSHRWVSSLYIGLAVAGVVLAAGYLTEGPAMQVAITGIMAVLCLSLWAFVARQERKRRIGGVSHELHE